MSRPKDQPKNLKPCPFCGASPKLEWADSLETFRIECNTENCYGSESDVSFNTREEAIAAWNRRDVVNMKWYGTYPGNGKKYIKQLKMWYERCYKQKGCGGNV